MRISFGNNRVEGVITLDCEREDIHFVLMVGEAGAGKSFFHRHVYHELVINHLPATLKFLFLDTPGADAKEWIHSPYLLAPVITDPEQALAKLEELARASEEKTFTGAGGSQSVVIHIEEDALVKFDRRRLEACFQALLSHRRTNHVYIFYSTSVVDHRYLDTWLKRFVDLRVIFKLPHRADAEYLAGGPLHFFEPGEHLLVWKGRAIRCLPFLKEN